MKDNWSPLPNIVHAWMPLLGILVICCNFEVQCMLDKRLDTVRSCERETLVFGLSTATNIVPVAPPLLVAGLLN